MKFYLSAQLLGIVMFIFMVIVVAVGLMIGYGWHIISETIDFVTLQSEGGFFSDTAKAATITALLLPYLVSGYITGRIANKAEYLNCLILAALLIGPVAYTYPPASTEKWPFYVIPVVIVLLGAIMAHWTRVSDEKRIAAMKATAEKGDDR